MESHYKLVLAGGGLNKIVMIFLGIILFIFAAILLPVILSLRNGEKRFRENCVEYDAIIVGYVRQDYTKWDIPQVSIEKDGDTAIYRCKSRRMNATTHPRGTKVRVAYFKKKFLGSNFFDVRIIGHENSPHPTTVTQTILAVMSLTFLILSALLVTMGLRSI